MLSKTGHLSDCRKAGLAVGLFPVLLAACSMMPGVTSRATVPEPVPSDTFKVLTYNALHGLAVGRFWVRPGESEDQRLARFTRRIEHIAEVQPDLMLLQEVNPLPEMAEDYVRALGARGLEYSEVHQVDACGLRLAPGLALLPRLNNGLVILAKGPLKLHKLDGLKLSGTGRCRDAWGIQLGELRYALIAEVALPASGMRYLVATAHLHSGVERDALLLHTLMEAHEQGRLHHYDELMDELAKNQERRQMEVHTLMAALRDFQARGAYAGVIVGGDFNFEPGSPEYREVGRAGFEDTHQLVMPEGMLNTYDPEHNPLAGHEEEALPPELAQSIVGESLSDRREIETTYRSAVRMARRIDFLFSMSFMPTACLRQELFGKPVPMGGPAGSDHYGVLNTYTYRRMPC